MLENMFLVENNVPDVYVNESKDFQLISRLYDLVIQSTRFSIDSMDNISDTLLCNNVLLPLIGTKVGFFTQSKHTDATLRKVLAAFPYIMKYKGSKEGLYLVLNLFERITNTKVSLQETDDPNNIIIRFYNYMINVELLYELIEYIRPTGLMFTIEFKQDVRFASDYELTDVVNIHNTINYADVDAAEESGVVVQRVANNTSDDETPSNVGFTVISKIYDTNSKNKGGNS